MSSLWRIFLTLLFLLRFSLAQEPHSHGAPEKLGEVSFPISCTSAVQDQFDRGVALLHSFAYAAAENAFQRVAELDPRCAIAHWGMAMAYFHQLWDPPLVPATISIAPQHDGTAEGSQHGAQSIGADDRFYDRDRSINIRRRNDS
jgi:hypothetical protein